MKIKLHSNGAPLFQTDEPTVNNRSQKAPRSADKSGGFSLKEPNVKKAHTKPADLRGYTRSLKESLIGGNPSHILQRLSSVDIALDFHRKRSVECAKKDRNVTPQDDCHLYMQTQDSLVNAIPNRTRDYNRRPSLIQKGLSHQKSFVIEPINIQLLAAKAGRLTLDAADYLGRAVLGKQPPSKRISKQHESSLFCRTSSYARVALGEVIEKRMSLVTDLIGCTKYSQLASAQLSGPSLQLTAVRQKRLARQPPNLWFINPRCLANNQRMTISEKPLLKHKISLTSNKCLKRRPVTVPTTLRFKKEPKSFGSPLVSKSSELELISGKSINLLTDEVESEEFEEDEEDEDSHFEDALITGFNLTPRYEEDWGVSNIGPKRLSQRPSVTGRTSRMLDAGEHKLNQLVSFVDNCKREHFSQQQDPFLQNVGVHGHKGKRVLRRLIRLLAEECNCKANHQRYRQKNRIDYEVSPNLYSAYYSKDMILAIRDRMLQVLGSANISINDRQVMHLLEDRLEEMYQNKTIEEENRMRQWSNKDRQRLLISNPQNQKELEQSLYSIGMSLEAQSRMRPAVFAPLVHRGNRLCPSFAINPLSEMYMYCYQSEHVKQSFSRSSRKKSGTESSILRRRSGGTRGSIFKKLRRRKSHSNRQSKTSYLESARLRTANVVSIEDEEEYLGPDLQNIEDLKQRPAWMKRHIKREPTFKTKGICKELESHGSETDLQIEISMRKLYRVARQVLARIQRGETVEHELDNDETITPSTEEADNNELQSTQSFRRSENSMDMDLAST